MPFAVVTCIAMRSAHLTATNDFEVMRLGSRMVTAVDVGDCLTSNGVCSAVSWGLLKSVEFQPLLQREPSNNAEW